MTISSRDKKLIIIVVGILAVLLSYFLVFSPSLEDNETVKQENSQLSVRVADLQSKVAKQEEYVNETERMNKEVAQILTEFPSYLQIENGIMDVVDIETRTGASVPSLTIGDYVLVDIATNTADTTNTTGTTDTTATTDTAGTTDTTNSTVVSSAATKYSLYDVNTNMSYSATYSGMKEVIDLIVGNSSNKRSVSSFSATFDNSTGEITGAVSFESYFIFGQDKDYVPADIPSIQHGTENIFGAVDYATGTNDGVGVEVSDTADDNESVE